METKDFVLGFAAGKAQGGGSDDPFSLTNYIESSGTQYIDTGYYVYSGKSVLIEIDSVLTNNNRWPCILGAGGCFINIEWGDGVPGHIDWGRSYQSFDFTPYFNKKSKIQFSESGFSIRGFGSTFGVVVATNKFSTPTQSMHLFTNNGITAASNLSTIKLYRVRIWEGSSLVHEFIPWRENGVACLKDTVTGNLFYNAGTGDFVYGTDS